MKTVLLISILSLGGKVAFVQNLLANGGFEDENICIEYDKQLLIELIELKRVIEVEKIGY